ncbi:SRPBCC family protein [Mycolicibacterium sediminis]|uniref:MxaD family protein n=1 Tax=Mycolicibacterium sediminis TaxID=1286180 RepID=A0A7I7QXE4_9MYCO|nr:SRPBCC family protein [Mycolicibacterium sediminis]BBY31059.1 MxaD family protein [Mycolicibacterium sediminis]
MAEISRRRTIAASQQDVWDVLADFGALATWVDDADHSSILRHGADGLLGTSRRVQMGRNALVETITVADAPHTIGYDIVGLPSLAGRLNNRWTLRPSTGATEVTLTSTVSPVGGPLGRIVAAAVSRVMARKSDAMLDGLARRLEDNHG